MVMPESSGELLLPLHLWGRHSLSLTVSPVLDVLPLLLCSIDYCLLPCFGSGVVTAGMGGITSPYFWLTHMNVLLVQSPLYAALVKCTQPRLVCVLCGVALSVPLAYTSRSASYSA